MWLYVYLLFVSAFQVGPNSVPRSSLNWQLAPLNTAHIIMHKPSETTHSLKRGRYSDLNLKHTRYAGQL